MQVSARRVPAAAAAVLLSLTVALGATAQSPALDRIRIDNFSRVNNTYYRGAQPVGSDYADLAALGVRTVIDLTSADSQPGESASVQQNGMRYVRIPMNTRTAPTTTQVSQFLQIVNDPASQPVYVHCVGGKHRTGVMTAVYRMTRDGISGDTAFREMKQFGYGADFLHPEFKKFVQTYDPRKTAGAAVATQQQQ
jgi:protein tyrosine/serine phosphatase